MKKLHDGMCVPDYDTEYQRYLDLKGWRSIMQYQFDAVKVALELTTSRANIAVDIGANIGIQSIQYSKNFNKVFSFEPVLETFECLYENTHKIKNIYRYNCGLGSSNKLVNIIRDKKRCGNNRLTETEGTEVEIKTLDSFELPGCDLLKIDVEGQELDVIQGALNTIELFRPVIVLEETNYALARMNELKEKGNYLKEEKPLEELTAARRMLEQMNYCIFDRIRHDFIMVPL